MLQDTIFDWIKDVPEERSVRASSRGSLCLGSDKGLNRSENQDRVAVMKVQLSRDHGRAFHCFIISDGMGGMQNGAVCAGLTVSAFLHSLVQNRALTMEENADRAARFANQQVYDFAKGRGGATLSAILLDDEGFAVSVNVGDSRIYNKPDAEVRNQLRRLTVDDNMKEAFGGEGEELVQFIGLGNGLRPHVKRIDEVRRTIYLTTDGIHFVGDELLATVLSHAPDARGAVERTLALARWLGSPDNATVLVLQPMEFLREQRSRPSPVSLIGLVNDVQLFWVHASDQIDQSSMTVDRKEIANVETDELGGNATTEKSGRKRRPRLRSSKAKEKAEQLQIDITMPMDASLDDDR